MVAISVDPPDKLASMRESSQARFEFLSDPEGQILDLFGVRHVDGKGETDIAQSASFLLDAEGRIAWKHVAENYRVRPNPSEILAAADRLQ